MRKALFVTVALAAAPAAAFVLWAEWPRGPVATTHASAMPTAYASVSALPPQPAPAPKPPGPPALPTVAVAPWLVHDVPSDANTAPARPYTIVPMAGAAADNAPPPFERPRPHHPYVTPVATGPQRLSGAASAAGGVTLDLGGRAVRLFGVRLAQGDSGAAARGALAQRLGAPVACDAPPGQEGALAYVCRDGAGMDLGERLVAEGLALADRSRSYEYVHEEEVARVKRLGLWAVR